MHFRWQLFGSLGTFGARPEVRSLSRAEYLTTFPTLEAAEVQIGVNGAWAGYIGGWREGVDRERPGLGWEYLQPP